MKKLLLQSFVLLCVLTAPAPAAAQTSFHFGIKGGIDVTDMKLEGSVFNASNRAGWFIGPTLKMALVIPTLVVDLSALYNQREMTLENTQSYYQNTQTTIKQQQIVFPLNLRFSVGFGSKANVFVFAGPQVGFNVGNSGKSLSNGQTSNSGEWTMKSSNFSVNVGGGLTISHLQLSANYNKSIGKTGEITWAQVWQGSVQGWDGHYDAWQLSAAWFF